MTRPAAAPVHRNSPADARAPAAAPLGHPSPIGWWTPDVAVSAPHDAPELDLEQALRTLADPIYVTLSGSRLRFRNGGGARIGPAPPRPEDEGALPLLAYVPPITPERLGEPAFRRAHDTELCYMAGSMANGIASVELVVAARRAGFLAAYGAAGQRLERVETAIDALDDALGPERYCVNLIHSPGEPAHEEALVDLLLARRVRQVEASAYLKLTRAVVRYRLAGIHRDARGAIVTPNRIMAKASRVEVARRWMAPPPAAYVSELLASRTISPEQAELAARIPMADDLTAEADSGGHTDRQPALALLPIFLALRDEVQRTRGYPEPPRVGAAGGIATPAAAAAAFAMGAAYVVSGSVNQACAESGSSDAVRRLLAEAQQADVAMAPAADMFEMGVKLQVLKRGTLFAMRAARLYEIYRSCDGLEAIPLAERARLERDWFRAPLEEIWQNTAEFFRDRDPEVVARAVQNPKQKMALVFRWYLGCSSEWANRGEAGRQADYQIWCGPGMGAFNDWVAGTFLAAPEERRIATVAANLMHGAAFVARANALRQQGIELPASVAQPRPRRLAELLAASPAPR